MNRTHLFRKNVYQGFTLIELLVVIAIIGLLSTIIAAPIQNARKKARDAKKIAEVKGVQLALDQYAEANAGTYPIALTLLAPTYMPLLPGFAATTSTTISPRDKFAYSPYSISGPSLRTSNFGYHLGVHLENFSGALDNDGDCMGAETRAGYINVNNATITCAFYPAAAGGYINSFYAGMDGATGNMYNYTGGMIPARVLTFSATPSGAQYLASGGAAATSSTDFDGNDGNIATCDGVGDCVFDVTAQQ
jgi:prepilin-type N-terminal cleavage/methylation domain-containing protein